ncbi:hypothetical protein D3C75_903100 [compost metagenome]
MAVVVTVAPPGNVMVTVQLASAVPLMVVPSALMEAVGASGAMVSTTTVAGVEKPPVPLTLVAVAVKAWEPSLNAPVGV